MWLLCVVGTFVLTLGECVVANTEYEFFQHEQVNFTCKHNKTISELSRVRWKKGTDICATILTESGAVTSVSYSANCRLEPRANLTVSELTIFSMESYDDGEFSCIAEDDNDDLIPTDTKFTVTVKVRPKNYQLLYNNESHNCNEEIIVDNTPNNSTLECSVESKPQATLTWSTDQALSESLLNTTKCVQDSTSLVYTCTNIMTVRSDKVTQSGTVVVTCHVEAVGGTKDLCVTLALLTTTQVITTPVEDTSTASPSTSTEITTTALITTTVDATSTASVSTSSSSASSITTSSSSASSITTSSGSASSVATSLVTTSSLPTTTAAAPAATTKSDSGTSDETKSSTSSPTTSSKESPTLTANLTVRLPNWKFEDDLGNFSSEAFKDLALTVCRVVNDTFSESLLNCTVTSIRNGSVLIDAKLQFNLEALTKELTGVPTKPKTSFNMDEAIAKYLRNNNDSLFQGAEIFISTDYTTESSPTTPVSPTSPPVSKWKNIYILPIAIGVAIIVVVIVLITYRCKNSTSKSNGNNHTRKARKARKLSSHRPPYAMQTAAYGTYDMIADTTPARSHMKPQHPNMNNGGRQQQKEVRGQPSNNGRGAIRNSELTDQNVNYRHPDQMRKNGRGATGRNEPSNVSSRQTRSDADRQFQQSSAARAGHQVYRGYSAYSGYPAYRGYPAYGGFPAYRGFPAARSQMPVMSHGPTARVYNNYKSAPRY